MLGALIVFLRQNITYLPYFTCSWYNHCAAQAWGEAMPTLQETRVHAKCLRSVSSVRVRITSFLTQ